MSDFDTHHKVNIGSERSFGYVFAGFFLIISLFPLIWGTSGPRIWALVVAAAFLIVTLFKPTILAPLNRLWFRFGLLLGKVIAPLIMALLYFVVITPIGLLARIVGKDFLKINKSERSKQTYWAPREHNQEMPPSMKNQF